MRPGANPTIASYNASAVSFYVFGKLQKYVYQMFWLLLSGANPTIASYNVSAVKIHNAATSSLGSFENKNILFYNEKRSSLLHRQRQLQIPKS
jgi:hypothetical protein